MAKQPKHGWLRLAHRRLAALIRELEKDGYPYVDQLITELNYRRSLGVHPKAEVFEWAADQAEGYLRARRAFKAKMEANERLRPAVEEYDEAMMVQDTFDKVSGL